VELKDSFNYFVPGSKTVDKNPYSVKKKRNVRLHLKIARQAGYVSVIPEFERLKEEDFEFDTRLEYTARPCLKTTTIKKNQMKKIKKPNYQK
jgi:hypothetical protein